MRNKIMKQDTLYNLQMSLIEKECLEQFVVGILGWYQNYKPVGFYEHDPLLEVPNLFQLFEYPTPQAEYVVGQFIKSDVCRLMKEEINGVPDYETMERRSVNAFNDYFDTLYEGMLLDVKAVLNAYNLFYYFQDDAQVNPTYHNPYMKEVW